MLQGNQLGVREVIEAVRSVRKQETQVVYCGGSLLQGCNQWKV